MYPIAEIYNTDTSKPISTIQWSQLTPNPAVISQNIFFSTLDDGSVGERSTGSTFKMKMSAMNFMSESQSIKLKATVTNSAGDSAIDIVEFFFNESPFTSNTVFTNTGGINNKEAMVTNFTINVSEWYDSVDDDEQDLEFRTYFVRNGRRHMLTAYSRTNLITVQLPYYSKIVGISETLSLCVEAKDKLGATTTSCQSHTSVVSNYGGSLSSVFNPISSLDLSQPKNMLKLSNAVKFLLTFMQFGERATDYSHPASEDYICAKDFHCNFNGR